MRTKEEQLKRPFTADEIEWRVQQSGDKNGKIWAMVLAYVTNRAIMDRLDEVFGIAGWKNEFVPTPSMDGVMCGISADFKGEWVTKYDGAANTEIESVKGGLSSSMKRTAVQFGIGRYLYKIESNFANVQENRVTGSKSAKTKSNVLFHWLPPELPPFALPIMEAQQKEIKKIAKETETDLLEVLKFYNYQELSNVTQEKATEMLLMLKKKQSKQNEINN